MALTTSININLGTTTADLTVTNASTVEIISYASNKITFDMRSEVTITLTEFVDYVKQINIFEESLLRNFNINPLIPTPFSKTDYTEEYKQMTEEWEYKFTVDSSQKIADYMYDISAQTITLKNRQQNATMEFSEWIIFLYSINHFKNSIK